MTSLTFHKPLERDIVDNIPILKLDITNIHNIYQSYIPVPCVL